MMIKRFFMGMLSVLALVGCSAEAGTGDEKVEQTKDKVIRHFELDGKNKPRVWDETIKVKVDYTKADGKLGTSKHAVMSIAAPSCGNDLMLWSETYGDGELGCVSGWGYLSMYEDYPTAAPQHMTLHWNVGSVWNFHTQGSCTFHGYEQTYPFNETSLTYDYNTGTWTAPTEVDLAYDVWCYPY